MGKQYRVRYKLTWPGLHSLAIYIIDTNDVIYSADNRLPPVLNHLNKLENQYVKLTDVMDLMSEPERYTANICLNKLIVEFNMRGLKTIASLSSTLIGQQVLIDQYVPLTTLLPFLMVCPSNTALKAFQGILHFLDKYLDTICFSCGFIIRNCTCRDGVMIKDGDDSVGYAISYCDKEVQTLDFEPLNSMTGLGPLAPLKCMEAMSKTGLSDGLHMPIQTGILNCSIGGSRPIEGNSIMMSGPGGVRVKLPSDINLQPGVRVPLTMVKGVDGPCLMPDPTHRSQGLQGPCSLANMPPPMPYMSGAIGNMNMMNYSNHSLPLGSSPRANYAPISLPPSYQHADLPVTLPDFPLMPMGCPLSLTVQNNTSISANYSATAYDPGTNPANMGPPRGQVMVRLPKHVNPKYINTTLGTFKRMGAARHIAIQVDMGAIKKKSGSSSEQAVGKSLAKVKLGKCQKRDLKKDPVLRAIDKIQQIQNEDGVSKVDTSSVDGEASPPIVEDGKLKGGSKKVDKVWRMIIDDEDSNEEEVYEKENKSDEASSEMLDRDDVVKENEKRDEDIVKKNDNSAEACDSKKKQDLVLKSNDTSHGSDDRELNEPDITPSDTETIGAEDQTESAVDLDSIVSTPEMAVGDSESVIRRDETGDSTVMAVNDIGRCPSVADPTGVSDSMSKDVSVASLEGTALESEKVSNVAVKNNDAPIGLDTSPKGSCNTDVGLVVDNSQTVLPQTTASLSPVEEIQKRTLAAEVLGSLASLGQLEHGGAPIESITGKRLISEVVKHQSSSEVENQESGKNTTMDSSSASMVENDKRKQLSANLTTDDEDTVRTSKIAEKDVVQSSHVIDEQRSSGAEKKVGENVFVGDAQSVSEGVDKGVHKPDVVNNEKREECVENAGGTVQFIEDPVNRNGGVIKEVDKLNLVKDEETSQCDKNKVVADVPKDDTVNISKDIDRDSDKPDLVIDEQRLECAKDLATPMQETDGKNSTDPSMDSLSVKDRNPNVDQEKKYFAKFEHLPTGEKLYKCIYPRCLQCFDTRVAAKLHSRCHSKNESVRFLLCLECEYKTPFFRWFDLLRHLRETHKMGLTDHQNGCLFCGLEFESQERLARHLEFHYSSRYKCVHCGLMMMSWGQVKQHTDNCPEKNQIKVNFGCPYCMFVFHKKTIRNLHMLSHSDSGLTCALCEDSDVEWQHWKLLRKHYQTRHSKALMAKIGPFRHLLPMKKRNPKCHVCGLEFKSFEHYSLHMIKVHDLVPFTLLSCRLCDKAFRTKRRLDYHVKNAHEEETACDECDYIAKNKTFLKLHVSQKHSEKQHMCTECGKSFMYYHQLRVHMAHHARKIVHTCRHCNEEFTRSAQLRKHVADEHAGPAERKTYNCSQCDYWTYAKSTLAYHVQKKHKKPDAGNRLENTSQVGVREEVSKVPDSLMYCGPHQSRQRKRKLPQEPSLTPKGGKRRKRKKLTMPTRRVTVSRVPKDSEVSVKKPLKCWIPERPIRNRDVRKRIRQEQIEQKRLKKMRKHSCARTRSVEEQKAIRDDLEIDVVEAVDVAKSAVVAYGKKFARSVSRDESMIVNLSYPYIDHNYYQLETQAEFSTFKSPSKITGKKNSLSGKSNLHEFSRLPVSMNVVNTPQVCGFEECATSPGEKGGRSKAKDLMMTKAGMSLKHIGSKQLLSESNGPMSSTPLQNPGGKLQSPVQIRSLLSRALQGSPTSANRSKVSMLSQQLKSFAMEAPSLEDFPELIGEAGEILPDQDLGLITDILNSIDTSGMNISGKTSDSTSSSQDISLPLVGQSLEMEPTRTLFTNGTSQQFLDHSTDHESCTNSSIPAATASGRVSDGTVPKPAGSNQTSVDSSFDDAILDTTRADLTNELPTDIDEIELKEADYQLWHDNSQPSADEQDGHFDNSLANAQIIVEFREAPVKSADVVSPPGGGGGDTNQSVACLLDHQYC